MSDGKFFPHPSCWAGAAGVDNVLISVIELDYRARISSSKGVGPTDDFDGNLEFHAGSFCFEMRLLWAHTCRKGNFAKPVCDNKHISKSQRGWRRWNLYCYYVWKFPRLTGETFKLNLHEFSISNSPWIGTKMSPSIPWAQLPISAHQYFTVPKRGCVFANPIYGNTTTQILSRPSRHRLPHYHIFIAAWLITRNHLFTPRGTRFVKFR